MAMFCGFTLGSALGGVAAAQLIAEYGWRSVLLLGGALLLVPVLWHAPPESVRFLVVRGDRAANVAAILRRIDPKLHLPDGTRFIGAHQATGLPVWGLLRGDVLIGTLLLWVTYFIGLLVVYLLSSWLPTLIHRTGVSLRTAALVTTTSQVGGTLGALVLDRMMDVNKKIPAASCGVLVVVRKQTRSTQQAAGNMSRKRFNPHAMLGVAYALAGLFIAVTGGVAAMPWLIAVAVFGAGSQR